MYKSFATSKIYLKQFFKFQEASRFSMASTEDSGLSSLLLSWAPQAPASPHCLTFCQDTASPVSVEQSSLMGEEGSWVSILSHKFKHNIWNHFLNLCFSWTHSLFSTKYRMPRVQLQFSPDGLLAAIYQSLVCRYGLPLYIRPFIQNIIGVLFWLSLKNDELELIAGAPGICDAENFSYSQVTTIWFFSNQIINSINILKLDIYNQTTL